MSTLAADVTFDFTFPPCDPTTPPSFSFDPSLLEIPYNPGHARSSSHGSVYSFESSPSDSIATVSTAQTTPARSPIRTHGPLLLPKIRSQDQAITPSVAPPAPKRARTSPGPVGVTKRSYRPSHARSQTNPEAISLAKFMPFLEEQNPAPLLCSPVSFTRESSVGHSRRDSTCSLDNVGVDTYSFPTYQMNPYVSPRASCSPPPAPQPQAHLAQPEPFLFQYPTQTPPALAPAAPVTADTAPPTTLYSYLTSPNPAPSLVRTLSFPLRDPNTRHFWWDVRQIRPWTNFTASTILSFPGASACLNMPVSSALLPNPPITQRHPETEQALHAIYAAHYLPKLNNALALCSHRPLKLSVPSFRSTTANSNNNPNSNLGMATDCMFVANPASGSAASSVAAIFGGKPTARVVGLVKSFDRFNTGMRVEGNVKRVEYLRGLAHLHHAMREHGCRYGFILTEIELVFVRNGAEGTPHFGFLEVGSVQLAATAPATATATAAAAAAAAAAAPRNEGAGVVPSGEDEEEGGEPQLTACLALWGLCMLAGDEPMPGQAHWKSEIGAPAEGTRRKALPRDAWMPQPQLAEKREAKRSRGWIWPEDPVSRREIGKRGVRYGGC